MVVVCHFAFWCRSGAVLKFDQFITQASKPSLDFFPRKCTCAEVICSRNMVLRSIGLTANDKLHSLTVKKLIIWYKYLLLPDRVFSELLGTNFNPVFLKVLKFV